MGGLCEIVRNGASDTVNIDENDDTSDEEKEDSVRDRHREMGITDEEDNSNIEMH